jgi:hypothetical protein
VGKEEESENKQVPGSFFEKPRYHTTLLGIAVMNVNMNMNMNGHVYVVFSMHFRGWKSSNFVRFMDVCV